MVLPIKGVAFCVKDVFAKKFLVPGENSAGGALSSVLRKHSTEGRTPDAVDPQIKRKISLHLRARRTRSVGRLIRRPARSPRPASIDRSLERPAKHEKDQHEHNADHDDLPLRNRASRAHARGHPHAGRRGEPAHVMAFLASDDNARAEKPDARHDALDHAALFGAGRRVDRQNGQGRAEAHEAERAHARRLAVQWLVRRPGLRARYEQYCWSVGRQAGDIDDSDRILDRR
jgi:hypothetical protein